jgi:TPR repeat protein
VRARLASAIAFAGLLAACAHRDPVLPPPEDPVVEFADPVSLSDIFLLDPSVEAELLRRAGEGDDEAAHRLSLHYAATKDGGRADRWLRTAAGLGNPVAQYSLWFKLHAQRDCATQQEAHAWLQRAADQGYETARSELASSKASMAACAR